MPATGQRAKVMVLKAWSDLYPWLEVLFFLPSGRLENLPRASGPISRYPRPPAESQFIPDTV